MVQRIGPEEVVRLMDETDLVLIDVTAPEEYARRHLPGAINIPVDAAFFDRAVRNNLHAGLAVVVYGGAAARTAAERIEGLGFDDVFELEDAPAAWEDEGLHLEGRDRGGALPRARDLTTPEPGESHR